MSAREFGLQLDAEWLAKQDDIAEAVSVIALDGLSQIVRRSPVDTGRFRGNWDVSIGSISTTFTQEVDPSGAATIANGQAILGTYEQLRPIYIQNNLPYAQRLENGWSGQAPQGMVGLTVNYLEAKYSSRDV